MIPIGKCSSSSGSKDVTYLTSFGNTFRERLAFREGICWCIAGFNSKEREMLRRSPKASTRWGQQRKGWPLAICPGHCCVIPPAKTRQEREMLSLLRQESTVDLISGLAQQFVSMIHERKAEQISTWLRDCQISGISELVKFAQGLEKEGSALHAAFTLRYSNGPVEGKINTLKSIKRSMYGRAGFPLLRQKVLKAA